MKRRIENSLSPGIRPTFSLLSVPWGQFFWRGATSKVAGEPTGVREQPSPMFLVGEKKDDNLAASNSDCPKLCAHTKEWEEKRMGGEEKACLRHQTQVQATRGCLLHYL